MKSRIDFAKVSKKAVQAMGGLNTHVKHSGLEPALLELVKMRASQINGCAFCLDMHSKDARAAGEAEQRLYLLNAWHEAEHLYTAREQAALRWTEALTLLTEGHVPDEVFGVVKEQFNDDEIVSLTLAVVAINGWNRICVSMRVETGNYRPGMFDAA